METRPHTLVCPLKDIEIPYRFVGTKAEFYFLMQSRYSGYIVFKHMNTANT